MEIRGGMEMGKGGVEMGEKGTGGDSSLSCFKVRAVVIWPSIIIGREI